MTKYNIDGAKTDLSDSCGGSERVQYYDWVFYNDDGANSALINLDWPLSMLTSNEPGQNDCPINRASAYLYEGTLVPISLVDAGKPSGYTEHFIYQGGDIELPPNSSIVFQSNFYNPSSQVSIAGGAPVMQAENISTEGQWVEANGTNSPITDSNQLINIQAGNGIWTEVSNSDSISYSYAAGNSIISYAQQYFVVDAGGADIDTKHIAYSFQGSLEGASLEDDYLIGSREGEIINGYAGDDEIRASAGDDLVLGDKGNDTLYGGRGSDFLDGGEGRDQLVGGRGKDKFVLAQAVTGAPDRILDFEPGQDMLAFNSEIFKGNTSCGCGDPLISFNFETNPCGLSTSSLPTFIYSECSHGLYFDADGSGDEFQPELIATMNTSPTYDSFQFF